MTIAALLRNHHPADELADVRAEIKRLQDREAELRDVLIADGADRVGVQFEVVIWERKQRHFNIRAAIEHFGSDSLAPFYQKIACKTVKLKPRQRRVRGGW